LKELFSGDDEEGMEENENEEYENEYEEDQ
jgi:hypothetical protein